MLVVVAVVVFPAVVVVAFVVAVVAVVVAGDAAVVAVVGDVPILIPCAVRIVEVVA